MLKYCEYCGTEFETANPRRIFCCPQHRRAADNERKAERRAEEAELRAEFSMPDDWACNDLGEDVMANALTDDWTKDCEFCADEAIAGPMACQVKCSGCKFEKARAKSRRKDPLMLDLVCAMCQDGVKVG